MKKITHGWSGAGTLHAQKIDKFHPQSSHWVPKQQVQMVVQTTKTMDFT